MTRKLSFSLLLAAALQLVGLAQATTRFGVATDAETPCIAWRLAVVAASTVTGVSVDLDAYASVGSILLCADDGEGAPDLASATELFGTATTSAEGAWAPTLSEEPEVDVGDYWVVLRLPTDSGTGKTAGIGYSSSAGSNSVLLGDGAGTWVGMPNYEVIATISVEAASAGKSGETGGDKLHPDPLESLSTEFFGATPNPVTGSTLFTFRLASSGPVAIDVFDVRGRLVKAMGRSFHEAGIVQISFDGRDDRGRKLGSGVYFARFTAGNYVAERRITWIR